MLNFLFHRKLEAEKTCGVPRSPEWPKCRKDFERKHPKVCAVCGTTKNIQLHHIIPFHIDPSKELDHNNLIWLCENNKELYCHLKFGHWGSFRNKWNPHIRTEAKKWKQRFEADKFDEVLV